MSSVLYSLYEWGQWLCGTCGSVVEEIMKMEITVGALHMTFIHLIVAGFATYATVALVKWVL